MMLSASFLPENSCALQKNESLMRNWWHVPQVGWTWYSTSRGLLNLYENNTELSLYSRHPLLDIDLPIRCMMWKHDVLLIPLRSHRRVTGVVESIRIEYPFCSTRLEDRWVSYGWVHDEHSTVPIRGNFRVVLDSLTAKR